MTATTPIIFIRAGLLIAAVSLTSAPRVQADTPTSADESRIQEAKGHFEQGKAFLDAKLFSQAIAEFQAAYALAPIPELVFNEAQARRLNGDLQQALELYKKYLREVPDGAISAEARVHVAELTAAIEQAEQKRQYALRAQEESRRAAENARAAAAEADYEEKHKSWQTARNAWHWALPMTLLSAPFVIGGVYLIAKEPEQDSSTGESDDSGLAGALMLGLGGAAALIGVIGIGTSISAGKEPTRPTYSITPIQPGIGGRGVAFTFSW